MLWSLSVGARVKKTLWAIFGGPKIIQPILMERADFEPGFAAFREACFYTTEGERAWVHSVIRTCAARTHRGHTAVDGLDKTPIDY